MAVSIAVARVIEKQKGTKLCAMANFSAGHSLGEYSALCAMGALSLADTARLLRIRGEAMQSAVPVGRGGMVALVGVDIEAAEKIVAKAQELGVCNIANDNGAGQIVLSGAINAIDYIVNNAKDLGVRRAIKLPVSAPFHSSLMQSAANAMKDALSKVEIAQPKAPIIANVSVKEYSSPDEIRGNLVEQVCGRVRWRETMEFFKEMKVERFVEIGPGKVLSGITSKMLECIAISISTPHDIKEFLK
jgi:malonyl CoA-acyl carrier protein transacylase